MNEGCREDSRRGHQGDGESRSVRGSVVEINEALAKIGPGDYQFRGGVPVDVSFYRLGSDLLFRGRFQGHVSGNCARCLESYPFTLDKDFTSF
jgi:uncharacterized metal-binding protein YceD (DUF177 family)